MSSTEDELEPFQGISNARYVDDTEQKTNVKAIKEENLSQPTTSTQTTSKKSKNELDNKSSDKESSSTKEKKKKKKRKRPDDFETSLQLLLNSHIKPEN